MRAVQLAYFCAAPVADFCSAVDTGLVAGLPSLIGARILVGIGEAGTIPTSTRAMANWLPVERRGMGQGVTHAAARLAAAATPLIVVMMLPWVGWRGVFIILGSLSFAWVVVWWFAFRDDPRDHVNITQEEIMKLPLYQSGVAVREVPWSRLIPRILPTVFVFFCHAWTLWLFLTWLPSFLIHRIGVDLKHSALFTSLIFAAGMMGDTLGGAMTDYLYRRTGNLNIARRNTVIFGFFFSLLSMGMVFLTQRQDVIVACLAISLFCLEMAEGPIWAVPMDIAPSYAGVAGGFISTAAGLGALCSPIAFGYITQMSGSYVVPFIFSIGLLAVGVVLSFFMRADKPVDGDSGISSRMSEVQV